MGIIQIWNTLIEQLQDGGWSNNPGPSKIPDFERERTRLWLSPEGICFVGSSLNIGI